ncbi:hypothetical protein HNQ92_005037 [Rhabdobacter roseus]|uniref:Uncharacterized protein n=1 Tax=Rhabdobacter roseus TaxID=1655419 RepID=A0A840TVE7_9BACT|nr:hypothetical protein [Rhabdobacter roseus]
MSKFSKPSLHYQVDQHTLLNRPFKKCHNCGQERCSECEICNGNSFDEDLIP